MIYARQSGSAIMWVLIGVALIAAIGIAFTNSTRTSTNIVTDEVNNARAHQSRDYSNTVNAAVKRLGLRGCADSQISYETPMGNNPNPSAPADERCHVFRVAGGGVQYMGEDVAPEDPCTSGDVGTICTSDSAIYIGNANGKRIYMRNIDSSTGAQWKTTATGTAGADNMSDGLANTEAMLLDGASHPAAQLCRSHGATWFLPSSAELNNLLWSAVIAGHIDFASVGIDTSGERYWISNQSNFNNAYAYWNSFETSAVGDALKTQSNRVRCVRH